MFAFFYHTHSPRTNSTRRRALTHDDISTVFHARLFASSSIAFLAARRSPWKRFPPRLARARRPTDALFRRFVPALAPRHLERVSVLRVARLSVFFLFCHPGATMEADADVDGARASAGTAAVGARGQFLSSVSFSNFYLMRRTRRAWSTTSSTRALTSS